MKKINFNQNWDFMKDAGGMFAAASEPITVDLPHDAMILECRNKDNPSGNGGGFFPGGNPIYRKIFEVPEEYRGKRVFLEFEGVYNFCRVYLNGNYICGNKNGYTRFYADLTGHLIYGSENVVEVKVINGNIPNSRWYTGTGIYRPVSMIIQEPLGIAVNGLKITTPEVAEDISTVDVTVQLSYAGNETRVVRIHTLLKDESGVVASDNTKVTVFGKDNPLIRQRIFVKNAKLWSTDQPNLYTCEVQILENETIVDKEETTFGIRHIQVDPLHGLRLNGKEIKLRGGCIHHDNGILGAAAFEDAEVRKIRQLKSAGFNALRTAHNPASASLLSICDRLGMLVMEESFDMWNDEKNMFDYAQDFSQNWENDLISMIDKDYNHPSVIMYSIGNEIKEIGTPEGAKWNRLLAEKIRELDASRIVTNALNGLLPIMDKLPQIMQDLGVFPKNSEGCPTNDVNEIMTASMKYNDQIMASPLVGEKLEEACGSLDSCGYNYMTGRYEKDVKDYPNRLIFGSETYPPQIAENWKYVKENPAIIGDFTWTAYDYLGEAGAGVNGYNSPSGFFTPYPCYLANVGDFDITGVRRPLSYYREIVWGLRKAPYIAVQLPEHYHDFEVKTPWTAEDAISTWTWPGFEEKPCKVVVYSCDDEVELFINGKSVGKQPAGEVNNFCAVFDTVYQPGTIEAIGFVNGNKTESMLLQTADEQVFLSVDMDKTELTVNGEEISYLTISLTDKNGILIPTKDRKVSLETRGPITIQGFGSADPFSTENFFDKERTTYRGTVLAAIRAGKEKGTAEISVYADECEVKTIKIEVK